ncbi:hypothetical protein GCM10018777_31580 [Streptomyces albogriseolus]|uniref:hypothetical protein n=1 Tax=Streptomyces TaxID=1883 RepID=UPI001679173D|nr:hypothetical protein [Streptomyces viridodiastaticus]GHG15509.1 hypothetical protein GCM10018777_31580 [Streptomyces viridodiastaticus]
MNGTAPDRTRVWLTRLSLAVCIAFTASAEYDLARTLGADPVIAAMLPVAVDAYVIAALRWFRAFDIMLSLAPMGAAQVGAHLLDARVVSVNIPLVVVVSLLVPVALWRTHALARFESEEVPEHVAEYEQPEVGRVPAMYPALADTPAVPELAPEAPAVLVPEVCDVPARAVHAKRVLAEKKTPRTRRVSAPVPVPDEDDVLVERARADFPDRVPTFRELKDAYSIGQQRARRIRAVLGEGKA